MQTDNKCQSAQGLYGRERGVALVSALVFLVITVIFVSTSLMVAASNRRLSSESVRTMQAQLAAEAGIDYIVHQAIYSQAVTAAADVVTLEKMRQALDLLGIAKNTSETTFGDPQAFSQKLEGQASYRVIVSRADTGDRTILRLDSQGFLGDETNPAAFRRITEDLVFQPAAPPVSSFALLTNNASCIFCHATISSLDVAYDGSSLRNISRTQASAHLEDAWRVRVGTLQGLYSDRPDKIESLVTGTIYTRGDTEEVLKNDSTLRAVPFKLTEDGSQATSLLSGGVPQAFRVSDSPPGLRTVNCNPDCSEANAGFYLNYPTSNYPDGELPNSFPLPVIDGNGDRIISEGEWQKAIAQELEPGSLSGGRKELVTTQLPGLVSSTLTTRDSGSGIKGNLILEGSIGDPLKINGTVYVDGDVVIDGYVTGDGKIIARGNVYITGHLRYACATASGGYSSCTYDNARSLPKFGIAAVKNIMIGPYQSRFHSEAFMAAPDVPNDILSRTDMNIALDDIHRYYHDPGFQPAGASGELLTSPVWPCSRCPYNEWDPYYEAYWLSFSMTQIGFFNQMEYEKALAGGYTPRFYRMRETSPVYRCGLSDHHDCRVYRQLTEIPQSFLESSGAATISLQPTANWLSSNPGAEAVLESELYIRERWIRNIEQGSEGSHLQVDGILYSGNAIFMIAPETSQIQGSMVLNGSLIAADTGVLVPGYEQAFSRRGGLRIHYDERLKSLLGIKDSQAITLTRTGFRLINKNETLSSRLN